MFYLIADSAAAGILVSVFINLIYDEKWLPIRSIVLLGMIGATLSTLTLIMLNIEINILKLITGTAIFFVILRLYRVSQFYLKKAVPIREKQKQIVQKEQ